VDDETKAVYQSSCDKLMPYLHLEGKDQIDPRSEEGKTAMIEGIRGLEVVLTSYPKNWPALWMLGKAQQALELHEEAYNSFLASHRLVLTNQDIMRELALECLHTKRFSQAVHYCHVAVEFAPEDYTLWPNMAVADMFNGNIDRAEKWANKALEKIPGDMPSLNVLKIIAEFREGRRSLPTDFAEEVR
jgi:tetratricopeptide (TPR) repeat protein